MGGRPIALFTLGLLAARTAQADCVALETVMSRVEGAILEGRVEDAQAGIEAMHGSLGCGAYAAPEELARMFLLEGATSAINRDDEAALMAFRAAHRMLPGFWNDDLGPQLRAKYEEAAADLSDPGDGTIRLDPPSNSAVALLDGERVQFPMHARAGLHVVQVAPLGESVAFGKVVRLLPEQSLILSTGMTEAPTGLSVPTGFVLPDVNVVMQQRRKPVWLVAGASAGALSLLSTVAWHTQTGAMRNAETVDGLDAARGRQVGYGVASLALGSLAAAGLTVHFSR